MTKRERAVKKAKDAELVADSIVDDMAARWAFADSGHAWFDLPEGRSIAPNHGNPGEPFTLLGLTGTLYYPMISAHGLFKQFASIEPTEDQFLKFADQFGKLQISGAAPEKKDDWIRAHRSIAFAVELWEWIQSGDDRFHLVSGPPDTRNGRRKWVLRRGKDYVASSIFEADRPELAAKRMLQERINSGLAGNVAVRVLWHEARREFVNRIYPTSLLGFMWWQFARAFTGEVKIVECKVCSKPLERGKKSFMATREFCSQACKQKDHRRKVKEAKVLREKGWTAKRIAARFDATPEVIKNWLAKAK